MLKRTFLSLALIATVLLPFAIPCVEAANSDKKETPAEIQKIRTARNIGYFRVVIDLGKKTAYNHSFSKADSQLALNFPQASVSSKIDFRKLNSVRDEAFVKMEYQPGKGSNRQLLLTLGKYGEYKVYDLANPNRIVVDIYDPKKTEAAKEPQKPKQEKPKAKAPEKPKEKPSVIVDETTRKNINEIVAVAQTPAKPTEIAPKPNGEVAVKPIEPPVREEEAPANQIEVAAKQPEPMESNPAEILGLGKQNEPAVVDEKLVPKGLANRSELTIVIDPGHGGKDTGAIGLYDLKEKDIVLDIGLRLREIIRDKYKCKVVMTRDTDVFIPLEERTKIAERNNASLFISVHVNATKRQGAQGIETYFLSPARSESALETQARENMVTGGKENENMSDLELIFASMKNTQKVNESSMLAGSIQNSLVGDVRRQFGSVRNLGVKTAMFVVLFWASMPSVLVETSFVSNPSDARRLKSSDFRQTVATSIHKGIDAYLQQATIEYNVKK